MKLHHRFFLIPKRVFDETHLFPVWRTILEGYGDVLPRYVFIGIAWARDYLKVSSAGTGNQERTVVIAGI